MPVRINKRVVSLIGCLIACTGMMAGCGLDNASVPQIRAVRIRYR